VDETPAKSGEMVSGCRR